MLQGARQTLSSHRPIIFLATHEANIHAECCTLLKELGYRLTSATGLDIHQTDELLAVPLGVPHPSTTSQPTLR